MLLFYLHAPAQVWVTGKVLDAAGFQSLEAASVSVLLPQVKTVQTDADGRFRIQVPGIKSLLRISLIGYKTITVPVDTSSGMRITMQRDLVNLEEVVVMQQGQTGKFNNLARIDLDLKPVRNTQELLRVVPGLFVAQHAGGGKAEQIFLRGFDCDHGTDIQVSVDGMPVNMVSHAHGQGYADAHFIIPETINSIDFGSGPYYVQHGNLNTAGYVSFGTYNSLPESRVQLETGGFQTRRALVMLDLLKKNKEKQTAFVAGEYYQTNGPTLAPQDLKRFNLLGKYRLAISGKTDFTAALSAFSSSWNASGQIPERAVDDGSIDRFGSIDPSEGGHTERYNANFSLAHRFNNSTTWENRAYASRYIFNLYSNFTFFLNDPVNGDEIKQAEARNLYGFSSQLTIKHPYQNWTWTQVYGTGMRIDATSNSQLAHVVKRQFISNISLGDIQEQNAFAYTQQQVSTGKWLMEGGIRLDQLNFYYNDKLSGASYPAQGKMIVSPKLNIQYSVNRNLQFYIKTGKGFHSNDTRVVVHNKGKDILPAAYGSDIGIIIKPTPRLLLNLAAWYLKLDQEFVYVGDEAVIEPSGRSLRKGIDLTARYQLSEHWFANLNLNATKPRFLDAPKNENYIPLAPTLSSTGGLYYKVKTGLNGSISYRYIKDRPADEDNSVVAKGYFVTDATLNYTQKKYELGITIENLFNTSWNEAQFATTSRLQDEPSPVTGLHFTPGTPFCARLKFAVFF